MASHSGWWTAFELAVGVTPVDGLYVNCGWGYAGFKATPAVGWQMAQCLASGKLPPMLQPFALERFGNTATNLVVQNNNALRAVPRCVADAGEHVCDWITDRHRDLPLSLRTCQALSAWVFRSAPLYLS